MFTAFQMQEIFNEIKFRNWQYKIGNDNGRNYLQIQCPERDNFTGQFLTWSGRKWFLSRHMTKSELVQTALKATLTAMEHEVREQFKYKGRSIFDPHYDVDKLWELRGTDCLDERG